ncbi:methylamine utilization protein [Undibacterium sp. Ren11W]|uniref:methylamine utilization protein n=1 Tax=Undibacterium sp. Ren11W TaxID=3413045 RepID=UPI003BF32CCB
MRRTFQQLWISLFLLARCVSEVCAANVQLSLTVRDTLGHVVPDAVAYLEPGPAAKVAPGGKSMTAEIEQRNKTFIPLVSVIQTGTAVFFPNNDTVRHHAYSFSPAKPFELKLYAGKPEAPVLFDKPGTVVIGCNIHDQMLAYIHVVDTPYFAKSDVHGKAIISQLPSGKYILKVWHYKQMAGLANYERSVVVDDLNIALQVELNLKNN